MCFGKDIKTCFLDIVLKCGYPTHATPRLRTKNATLWAAGFSKMDLHPSFGTLSIFWWQNQAATRPSKILRLSYPYLGLCPKKRVFLWHLPLRFHPDILICGVALPVDRRRQKFYQSFTACWCPSDLRNSLKCRSVVNCLGISKIYVSRFFSCPGQLNRWPCHWLTQ